MVRTGFPSGSSSLVQLARKRRAGKLVPIMEQYPLPSQSRFHSPRSMLSSAQFKADGAAIDYQGNDPMSVRPEESGSASLLGSAADSTTKESLSPRPSLCHRLACCRCTKLGVIAAYVERPRWPFECQSGCPRHKYQSLQYGYINAVGCLNNQWDKRPCLSTMRDRLRPRHRLLSIAQ